MNRSTQLGSAGVLLLTLLGVPAVGRAQDKAPADKAAPDKAADKAAPDKAAKAAPDKAAPDKAAAEKDAKDAQATTFQRFRDTVKEGRRIRCSTALCWGGDDGFRWALEPLVELPIGKTFALPSSTGVSTLGRWINTHDVTISFAGGLRFWMWDDLISFSTYFSQPLTNSSGTIHVPGSDFDYAVSNVRRPYPGMAIGLMGDTLWLGFDYQELVNGDSSNHLDPHYAPSALVSRSWSLTIGLATVNTVRWGIGTAASKKQVQTQEALVKELVAGAESTATDAAKSAAIAETAATTAVDAVTKAADAAKTPAQPDAAKAAINTAKSSLAQARQALELAKAKTDAAKAKASLAKDKASDAQVGDYQPRAAAAETTATAADKQNGDTEKTLDGAQKTLDATQKTLDAAPKTPDAAPKTPDAAPKTPDAAPKTPDGTTPKSR
jgi:hypothetical protein